MNSRLVALFVCAVALAFAAEPAAPAAALPTAKTLKKSNVTVGSAIVPLTPGTKLEILGREGDALIVKFRSTKGKVPLADTDFDPATALPEVASLPAPAPAAPAASAVKPSAPVPPALNTSGTGQQPATNYGKAVQKAKQVTETQKSTRVDPTKEIMDEKPKE